MADPRPFGFLPARWVFRWVLYAISAGALFAGADALVFDRGAQSSIISGAFFGFFFATVGIFRERRGARRRRSSRRRGT